jgi:hypothetical protein
LRPLKKNKKNHKKCEKKILKNKCSFWPLRPLKKQEKEKIENAAPSCGSKKLFLPKFVAGALPSYT